MWFLILFVFSGWSNEKCISDTSKKSFLPDNNCNPIAVDNEKGAFITWAFGFIYFDLQSICSVHIDKLNNPENYLNVSIAERRSLYAGYTNVLYKDSTVYYIWDDMMVPLSVYETDYVNEIFYRIYYWNINYGTWGNMLEATSNDLKYSYSPSADIDENGTVYTAWEDLRTGIPQIFYKKYVNGVWTDAKQISQSPYFAAYPSITANNGKVYIFWEDGRDKAVEIYMRIIENDSIYPEQRITSNDGYFSYGIHSVSGSDGSVHIVWTDERDGYPQVYYSKYSNNVWTNPINVSGSLSDAVSPSIDVDTLGKPHIVWSDKGENEGNIYYIVLGDTFSQPVKVNEATIKCSNPFIAVDTMGMAYITWIGVYKGQYYNRPQLIFKKYTPDKSAKSTRYASIISRGPVIISENDKKWNKVVIYDIMGRRIRVLFPEQGKLIWKMDKWDGKKVKNGIYFLHIEGKNVTLNKKVVYIGGKK